MLRIVTDGAADMPPNWEQDYAIHILPLHIRFGEEAYVQGQGFSREDFYRLVRERKIIPKTSLPSIGQIKEFYHSIAQAGDTILSIHISSRLSGTYNTVHTAALEMADEFKVVVMDSLGGSASQAFLAREARRLERAGMALPEILRRLEQLREQISITFTLDTLEYAYLSGRISALQNLIVAALKVKPIIEVRDGLLEIVDKVRTRQRSMDQVVRRLQEKLGAQPLCIAVIHAADPQAAAHMCQQIVDRLNVRETLIADLSTPLAANLGPGAIGVIAYPVSD